MFSPRAVTKEMSRNLESAEIDFKLALALNNGSLAGAERIIRTRAALESALSSARFREMGFVASALSGLADIADRAEGLFTVRQAAARFVSADNWPDDSGYSWPVRILQAGWAHGTLIDVPAAAHYFPAEILPAIAKASNGARFRKRHPQNGGGTAEPELIAGWMSDCKSDGSCVTGVVNLLPGDCDVRFLLLAARQAGKLDLFGISVAADFAFKRSVIEGRSAYVANGIQKLYGIDLCAEPGAGGRFLS